MRIDLPSVAVTLTWSEMRIALEVGTMRQLQNLANHRVDAHGLKADDDGWGFHIEGAAGEMAVAKHLGIYWSGNLGDLKADDAGRFQVRTRSQHNYDLIVHRSDRDDRQFILVTGRAPHFVVRGWIMGQDAKMDCWWKDPAGNRPAFFVPQSALADIASVNFGGTVDA